MKLNMGMARGIRNEYFSGNISRRELANKYNVTKNHIDSIIGNRCWTEKKEEV